MPAYTNGVTNGLHPAVATHVNGVNRVNGVNGTHSTPAHPAFDSIPDAIEAFGRGEFVIVLDSPSRENEGDLIGAASLMTPAKMAFIIRYTSGYLCAPIPDSTADRLELPLMIPRAKAQDPNRTAYTISIDAEHPDISTGISAADRALTCRTLADPAAVPSSFRRPGHILPLRAREGGVRARRGHTEAATDLCRLAGLPEAGILGEMILDGDVIPGKAEFNGAGMMRRDDCLAFGKQWDIKVITIEDMVTWLEENEGRLQTEGVDY